MLTWAFKKLLFILALVFVVMTAIKLGKDWDSASVRLSPSWLLLSLPSALLACHLQGVAFHRLLETWTGQTISRVRTRELFFASQLARYTPGRLGLLAIRLARASELNLSKEHLGAATLGEVLVWLVSGMTALTLALASTDAQAFGAVLDISGWGYAAGLLLFLGAVALCTVPRLVWWKIIGERIGARLLAATGKPETPLLPVSSTLLVFLHWLLWIVHGSLLGLSVGMPLDLFTFSGTALLLSIFAGFFSFFAPAGVGVREAVLAYCLSPWVGAANATLVGVLARAASLAAELVLYSAAKVRLARAPAEPQKTHPS